MEDVRKRLAEIRQQLRSAEAKLDPPSPVKADLLERLNQARQQLLDQLAQLDEIQGDIKKK